MYVCTCTRTYRSSKVPLVPRKPPPIPSPDDKAGAGGKKKDKVASEEAIPQPPSLEDPSGLGLDQQLVVHTYNTALTNIQTMVRQPPSPSRAIHYEWSPQIYPQVQSLDSSIETTTALLQPPPPATSQQPSGAQPEEKAGGKGGKDKGDKVDLCAIFDA